MPKLIKIETSSDVANYTPDTGYATLFYAVVEGKIVLKCKTSAGVIEDVSVVAKEDVANKATDFTAPDDTTYPTTLAVATLIGDIDSILDALNGEQP